VAHNLKGKGYYLGQWWHSSLSDQRYKPRWWERDAYIEGLRDALRIVELVRYKNFDNKAVWDTLCAAEKNIYARARKIAPDINGDDKP
jgi:hypothetical protein